MFDFSCFKEIIMGGAASSTPREKCGRGCWKFRKHYSIEDDVPPEKTAHIKRPRRLTKLRTESTTSSYQCNIPTPSVLEHHWNSEDFPPQPPTQEKLMQIISCFPFPTPRQSPTGTVSKVEEPPAIAALVGEENIDEKAFSNAFGRLVQVSFGTVNRGVTGGTAGPCQNVEAPEKGPTIRTRIPSSANQWRLTSQTD